GRATEIVDEHEVIPHTAILVALDAVEDLDHGADFDDKACFLEELARRAVLEVLAHLERAAGQAPAVRQRLVLPLDQHHARTVEDDAAPADDGTCRVEARRHGQASPNALTTTRLRRWPSNSA